MSLLFGNYPYVNKKHTKISNCHLFSHGDYIVPKCGSVVVNPATMYYKPISLYNVMLVCTFSYFEICCPNDHYN